MNIYLASPFFNELELPLYRQAIKALRAEGHNVYVPQEHTIDGAWDMSNELWAKCVYADDVTAINHADVVVALNFGMYSDSGTAWECGYARALGTAVVQVLCGEPNTAYSMMMISSADKVVPFENVGIFNKCSPVNLDNVIQK